MTHATSLFLLLASTTFSLAIGEFGLGLLFHKDILIASTQTDYVKPYYWQPSDLGFQAPPGRHTSKKITSDGEVVYDVTYTIGEDGFRVTPQSDSDIHIRVNFFGCSLLFGEGLNDNETLPYFLHVLDNSITVKNFAWHGYGVHQALRILVSPRDTRGDINFLLTAPWHAERAACVPDYSNGSPRYRLVDDGELILDGTCGFPFEKNNMIYGALGRSRLYHLVRYALKETQDRQVDLYLAIIRRINDLSQARNQRFIVGFIKADDQWFTGTYSNGKIVSKLSGMGIEVVDVTLSKSARDIPREYYIHPLDQHPSAKANEARAKILREYIQRVDP